MSKAPGMDPNENEQNWLQRFLARATRRGHGDIIAANIGQGAQNVAVGKFILQNNVRIGTLVVPIRFIVALLAAALVVAIAVWIAVVPDKMPESTFNVAVADLGQLDKNGQVHASKDGASLSQWMFGKLQAEAASLPKDIKVEIWHDSLGWLRKRSPIGVIATEAQAANLAKRINAHMVIYGTLDVNQDPATFTPKFYAATVRSETAEIIGGQQLGAPVAFRSPVDFNDTRTGAYFDKNLKPRATALVWFTWGLALDLTGQNDKALQVFREAEPQFRTWSKDQGNEILYVFMGREAMFLARNETEAKKAFNSSGEAIAFAEDAFTKALKSNSSYDRAYLWMGNVYSERAQRLLAGQLDQDNLAQARADLDQATSQYQAALEHAETISSVVGVRTQLSLGTVDYLKAYTFLSAGDHASADLLYQSAIDRIQKTLPLVDQDQHRILAQTFQILGAAYFSQGYANPENKDKSNRLWDRALFYFDQCLLQANRDTYDEFLQDFKDKYCSEGIKEVGKAKEQRNSGG